jgi:hypothetical protein
VLRTSDDTRALGMAARVRGVRVQAGVDSLIVRAAAEALDQYVIALGCGGVAVRGLERRARSLETLFEDLTAGPPSDPAGGARPQPPLSLVGR